MAANFRSIRYSLVIPVFNEEAVLPVLLRRLDLVLSRLDGPAEAIFVDDGSSDSSSVVLRALGHARPALSLYRPVAKFRPSGAITAGMEQRQVMRSS